MLLTRPKSTKPPTSSRGGRGPLSTRGGTLLVAALLSLVAGAALLIFLRQYREDITGSDKARVLVAASVIPKGTRGEIVLERRMYRIASVRQDDLKAGAFKDPSDLEGSVTKADVYPGHQLTPSDFESADSTVGSRLADYERAMTVPVDRAHGLVGKIKAGDRVDVVTTDDGGAGALTIATVVARDVLVLAVPDGDGSGVAGRLEQVTIRVPDTAGASIAAAADGGKVWLMLRPAVGARAHSTDATVNGVVKSGTKPLNADVNISAQVRQR
jgi:Flp pilus assembly protein CpaB